MTIHWHFEKSSPRSVTTGESDQIAGSRGTVTQYNSGAEIIRMPSGSIVSIPHLETSDLPKSSFNEALVFALLVNFAIWGLLALAVRALFFAVF